MRATPRALTALAAIAATLALPACGEDDGPEAGPQSADAWVADANRACEAGAKDAVELRLPTNARQIERDAAARVDILTTVRDEIAALERPEEVDPEQLDAYLAELDDDIEELERPSGRGGYVMLDESAGAVAGDLGLRGCAALANAIARTP